MHKVGVKAIVFANTPENQRLSKSVFKVTRIIDIVDYVRTGKEMVSVTTPGTSSVRSRSTSTWRHLWRGTQWAALAWQSLETAATLELHLPPQGWLKGFWGQFQFYGLLNARNISLNLLKQFYDPNLSISVIAFTSLLGWSPIFESVSKLEGFMFTRTLSHIQGTAPE